MTFHLRKAPPTDFSDLMDHHECFLIDIHDDPVQFLELPSGNNGNNSHGRLSQMTALDLEQGRPAVKLLLYCKIDRLIFSLMIFACTCFLPIMSILSRITV